MTPGSTLWLLLQEFRLQRKSAATTKRMLIIAGCLFLLLHAAAFPLAFAMLSMPAIPHGDEVWVYAGATAALLFLLLTTISTTLISVVQAIYGRGDIDLWLSSPLAPRSIVLVRVGAIALKACLGWALFALPFADAFGLVVAPKWFALYLVVPSLALLGTGVSLVLAVGLYRLLGPRRTRVFAQILGAVIGMMAMLPQFYNFASREQSAAAAKQLGGYLSTIAWPALDSWIWLPARALMAEPFPAAMFAIVCFGTFTLAAVGLASWFVASMAGAQGTSKGSPRKTTVRRFNTATLSAMRRKDILLIARDPWLLTQVLQQAVASLPFAIMIWRFSANGHSLAWAVMAPIAGGLAAALTWLTVSGERAPDLLYAAPVRRFDVLRAKLEAALVLIAGAMTAPIAIAWYVDPWLGQVLLFCCTGAAISNALLEMRYPAPGRPSEFNQRRRDNWGLGLLEMLIGLAWGGTAAGMMASGLFAFVGLALLALIILPMYLSWRETTAALAA